VPFTPSHAIVALPFARTPLPAGAVAVGAMAPDLPLVFPGVVTYGQTHGFPSLLVTSLPLALVLYAVWRVALRPAASGLLPSETLRSRVPWNWDRVTRPERPLVAGLLVVAAALIGVVSHVVWDLFTHPGRLGSEWIPSLADSWGPIDGTTWLQYGSSVLGLVGVGVWAALALRQAGAVHRVDPPAVGIVRRASWVASAAVVVTSFAVRLGLDGIPATARELARTTYHAGTFAGAVILVIALLAAVAVRVLRLSRAS
jgi:hypothetical protein